MNWDKHVSSKGWNIPFIYSIYIPLQFHLKRKFFSTFTICFVSRRVFNMLDSFLSIFVFLIVINRRRCAIFSKALFRVTSPFYWLRYDSMIFCFCNAGPHVGCQHVFVNIIAQHPFSTCTWFLSQISCRCKQMPLADQITFFPPHVSIVSWATI